MRSPVLGRHRRRDRVHRLGDGPRGPGVPEVRPGQLGRLERALEPGHVATGASVRVDRGAVQRLCGRLPGIGVLRHNGRRLDQRHADGRE